MLGYLVLVAHLVLLAHLVLVAHQGHYPQLQTTRPHTTPLSGPIGTPGPVGARGAPGAPGICPPVEESAFAAELGKDHPEPNQPIVFHRILHNDQKHFDEASGIFTCQIPGFYYFVYNLQADRDAHVMLALNGTEVVGSHKTVTEGSEDLSGSMILKLDKGDHVWLEAKQDSNGITEKSSFLGYLIPQFH
uniref:C1q domain-containing protein n=1 Tax=Varanus komodoensis TaxID=61221 RepID=A0A8D2KV53_VARKO